jgi:predicted dehydrogenase/threonine dehydrogenase-like Zn-dependent dehydrogenase
MKAIVQSYGSGELTVTEVPAPALRPGGVLVRNRASLVSAGTERLMVELAQKSLLGKARDRPDLVRRVLGKLRRDGLFATLQTVRSRLDAPVPLGYSSAGTVLAVGEGVSGLRAGDRVACAGAGYASHAEVVFVPRNLAVAVPPEVPAEAAAFTTVGAIALEGLRLARLELGETVAVIGLGLVGLLAAQLARAAGCRVVGMDTDPERCRLAGELGVEAAASEGEELVRRCRELTAGHGADKVIVAASTKSSQPLELAAEVARERGIVSVVGAVGMELPRQGFYDKELTLAVSRSYGPGRYDPEYEEKGRDYPYAHVRWTENRNMQAFVDQLAAGRVDVAPLISHRFPIDDAERAYALLTGDGTEPYLGIVLTYPGGDEDEATTAASQTMELKAPETPAAGNGSKVGFGVLGAGQFAVGTLLPALVRLPSAELAAVCTATGVKAEQVGRKFGFRLATTSESAVLERPEVGAVLIATRHHLHARQVIAALEAGKDVFVEKPLCLSEEELAEIEAARAAAEAKRGRPPLLMVGYNRRFAPLSRKLKDFAAGLGEPLVMGYRVNAGYIPPDHWTQDPEQGGGRILGEVCHFVDYLAFVAGAPPVRATARVTPDAGRYRADNLVATIELADGSVGTVTYVANGDPAVPKERFELFGGGAAAVLDNFRTLELIRGGRRRVERSRLRQDKGHADQLRAFVDAARTGGPPPIPWAEIAAVSRATFALAGSAHAGSLHDGSSEMKLSG